jgi:hypothetical protein
MLLSILDFNLKDRVADAREQFRDTRTVWKVWLVLVIAWAAFLVIEDVWKTMTSRNAPVRAADRSPATAHPAS